MATTLLTSKVVGEAADTPSGVAWSADVKRDLDAAVMSHAPPDRAEFQGRTRRFFFITGMGKSGTNWLANVLNLHPEIYVDPAEFQFQTLWTQGLSALCGPGWHGCHREPYKQAAQTGLHDLVRRVLLAGIANKPEVTLVGDKSPRWFSVLVPGCPVISMVRDGRDVMVSYTFHHLRLRPENIKWWPRPVQRRFPRYADRFHADIERGREVAAELLSKRWWLEFVAKMWADRVTQDREKIEAARTEHPSTPVMTLHYERLHAELEPVRAEVYQFLGVDPALAAPASDDSRTRPGFERENLESFYRKGQPGDWKNYRNPAFDAVAKGIAGDALVREGYEQDTAW
jgi:hypothetical protein